MSIPRTIGHLVLNVADVERSTAFYRDIVGFELARKRPDRSGERTGESLAAASSPVLNFLTNVLSDECCERLSRRRF